MTKIFGDEARKLKQGQRLVVFKYTVEGRDCAELVPEDYVCSGCGGILKEISLGHDDYDLICPRPECSNWAGIIDRQFEWRRYSEGKIDRETYEKNIALSNQ